MNPPDSEITSRRALWLSAALGLALLLALGAFFALQGRVTPLWVLRHTVQATAP